MEKNLLSSKERGERLRQLRKLARFKQSEISNIIGVSLPTYKGWEVGLYGGISSEQAKNLVDIYSTEGVNCTLEWIIYGPGAPPSKARVDLTGAFTLPELETDSSKREKESDMNQIMGLPELAGYSDQIKLELRLFRSGNLHSFYLVVQDESMLPLFVPGDIVGGVRLPSYQHNDLVGLNCIVKTKENQLFLRQIQSVSRDFSFSLFCINPQFSSKEFILSDTEISAIYPVIWHRKKNPDF